jgi:hypothetical protein
MSIIGVKYKPNIITGAAKSTNTNPLEKLTLNSKVPFLGFDKKKFFSTLI